MAENYQFETRCIHGDGGFVEGHPYGAVSVPIFQTATFAHPGIGKSTGYDYSRESNPTRYELESVMSSLEGADDSIACSTGMAAIGICLELFGEGDHILCTEDLYGGTVRMFESIGEKRGLKFSYVDTSDIEVVKASITSNTKAIFVETPSNPMMLVSDIAAISELAHAHQALLIVDNTFLSPHFQKPLTLGADIVIHSGTKYLCGHNDVVGGLVIVKEIPQVIEELDLIYKSEGASLGPFDSWLMLRSIKTLALRVEKQEKNALQLASWLKTLPTVTDVYYVGLKEHPSYELTLKQTTGFGGMISFKVKSAKIAEEALGKLKLVYFAESLGGVETLLTYPIEQTHAEAPKELLARVGVDDRLLRLSVGIEDVEDLKEDLEQALAE